MSERSRTAWEEIEIFSTPILGNLSFKPLGLVSASTNINNDGGPMNPSASISTDRAFHTIKEKLKKAAYSLGADTILDFTFLIVESPNSFNENKHSLVAFAYGTAILKPWPFGHGHPDIYENGIWVSQSQKPTPSLSSEGSLQEGESA